MQRFTIGILIRVGALVLACLCLAYWAMTGAVPGVVLATLVIIWLIFSLYYFVTGINRKLIRFFDAVRYSDFVSTFRSDDQMGDSFREINLRFNAVLDDFRQARAEKEAGLQYLQTVVQQVNVGLIVANSDGRIELQNQAALRLLGVYRLRKVQDLEKQFPEFAQLLSEPKQPINRLLQLPNGRQLACQASGILLRGRRLHIVTFQNIRSELQQKEIEAWQNLTRVLRHEIMNSVTPLVTLVGAMKAIVEEDLPKPERQTEAITDLSMALDIVEQRGRGIMRFVDAYRSFSNLPQPAFEPIALFAWLEKTVALVQPDLLEKDIQLQFDWPEERNLMVNGDDNQLEMVLLNLIKNAAEALAECPKPRNIVLTVRDQAPQTIIEISDNGRGIPPEHFEQVFIPFFTTKKEGSGIGLSLSRQIITQHNGLLSIHSTTKGTTVRIDLPQ